VLGASGFIGRNVARALVASGARVTAAVRDGASARAAFEADEIDVDCMVRDLLEPGALEEVFAGAQPAVTFNLAGYGVDRSERDAARMWRINVELVERVAALAGAGAPGSGMRLIHTGSALEYGAMTGTLSEDAAPNPTTDYGRSKLEATRYLAARAPARSVTARLFTVYGQGEHEGRLLPSLMAAREQARRIPLSDGTQRRDFIYVDDVAEGLLRLGAGSPIPGGVVNLATGVLTSVREFALRAARTLRIPESDLDFGALPQRADEMAPDRIAVDLLRRSIGWVPAISIEDGVRRTARHLHQESTS
jgi:nucleoside-diphosphate-sugar epimerase